MATLRMIAAAYGRPETYMRPLIKALMKRGTHVDEFLIDGDAHIIDTVEFKKQTSDTYDFALVGLSSKAALNPKIGESQKLVVARAVERNINIAFICEADGMLKGGYLLPMPQTLRLAVVTSLSEYQQLQPGLTTAKVRLMTINNNWGERAPDIAQVLDELATST